MLTGQRLFTGETTSHVLAAVLTKEPDFERVPVQVRRLLRSCLQKDAKQRLQAIGDWQPLPEQEPVPTAPSRPKLAMAAWIAAGVCSIAALALGYVAYRHWSEETRLLKFSVMPPERATFDSSSVPAMSPDGRRIAFRATVDGRSALWVRDLDALTARQLPGTDGGHLPFWSPDSRWIAFFAAGKLKKIEVGGGPALTLCDTRPGGRGGTWNKNDVIVFARSAPGGLFRVPAAGGSAIPVTEPDQRLNELGNDFPWFLPDGRHFLYMAANLYREQTAIYIGDLNSKDRRRVLLSISNAVFLSPGYLLFLRGTTLMAQPFDAGKLEFAGDAVPVAERVDQLYGVAVSGQFSSSQNGVLAYTSGAAGLSVQVTWFDRSGKAVSLVGMPGEIQWAAISPDGKTVAMDRRNPQTGAVDLWLRDLGRGTESRFTFGPRNNEFPVWSPDGATIAFYSLADNIGSIFQKATSGVAQEQALDQDSIRKRAADWSRDGRYIIEERPDPKIKYEERPDPKIKYDIWVLPLFGDRKPFPYLHTEFTERNARLSPNGQWLA